MKELFTFVDSQSNSSFCSHSSRPVHWPSKCKYCLPSDLKHQDTKLSEILYNAVIQIFHFADVSDASESMSWFSPRMIWEDKMGSSYRVRLGSIHWVWARHSMSHSCLSSSAVGNSIYLTTGRQISCICYHREIWESGTSWLCFKNNNLELQNMKNM